jgi:hypothetical protein
MANGKTFEQTLAETGRQSTLDELRRTGRFEQAKSEFEAGRGQFAAPTSPTLSTPDFGKTIERAIELQKKAAEPAIAGLRATIPEVQQRFETQRGQVEAQREPLKQRYQNLLADIKGQAKTSEEAQTRITSGELGKRGIVGSSTLAQQQIQQAVEPIRAGARTATKEVGLAQEEGLRNLTNIIANLTGQETSAVRDVTNAIAQLQAGGAQTGISQGLAQEQAAQQTAFQQQQFAAQQAEAQKARDFQEKVFQQVTLPESQAALAKARASGEGLSITDFFGMFGGGGLSGLTGGIQSTGFSNVDSLLAEGKFDEARQLLLNP